LGKDLKAPLRLTWSCYDPKGEEPCTVCPACVLRQNAEREGFCKTSDSD
jgi:7-cyano-7-deazaguanine synthase in queuosine biosynthesis